METITQQNGIRFSVKWKLLLHKCFPSKLCWNEYIVYNWRYRCNTIAIPLQNSFQSVSPETFRNPFLSIADYCFTASGPFLHSFESCKTVAKSLLHKIVEMLLSVSAGFSLYFQAKSRNGYQSVKTKNRFHPFATIMQRLIWRSSLRFHKKVQYTGYLVKTPDKVRATHWILDIEDLHVTSTMTSPMVTAMLEVFFLHRAGRLNGNNVRKRPKIGHFSGQIETFQCIKSNWNFDVKIWKVFIYLHLDFLGN
jgi:hypothetical protein